MFFGFTDTDETSGVTFHPWTDGWAVGFKVIGQDGSVEYVYLNPSGGSDDGQSSVFVYHGTEGDPCLDDPAVYIDVLD